MEYPVQEKAGIVIATRAEAQWCRHRDGSGRDYSTNQKIDFIRGSTLLATIASKITGGCKFLPILVV